MHKRRAARDARDPWTDRLSEYLDGELEASERERLEMHLATCQDCATVLAGLREVVARARSLEDAPPAVDLWPAIASRLVPRRRRAWPGLGRLVEEGAWWTRRFELGLPQLAAAAVLLVALSAGTVWLALRGAPPRGAVGGPGLATPVATTAPAAGPEGTASLARGADPRYDAAVAELERTLADGRGKLDPRTLRVIEENLLIIDRAIDEARRAVAADPGNTWLRSHLASTMRRKVDLLRSATMLADAQG